jgi:hypothetical protein
VGFIVTDLNTPSRDVPLLFKILLRRKGEQAVKYWLFLLRALNRQRFGARQGRIALPPMPTG